MKPTDTTHDECKEQIEKLEDMLSNSEEEVDNAKTTLQNQIDLLDEFQKDGGTVQDLIALLHGYKERGWERDWSLLTTICDTLSYVITEPEAKLRDLKK